MKEINLTQGKVALVDDENYDFLNQFKWYARRTDGIYYAGRQASSIDGKRKIIHMHRVIMETPWGFEVDHINHDGLNNQKYNMRNCIRLQNARNRQSYGSSQYLGVSWYNRYNCWVANITIGGKRIHLGYFKEEEDAAKAYNTSALYYYEEFANLNMVE